MRRVVSLKKNHLKKISSNFQNVYLVGKEGPFVHLACIVSFQLCRLQNYALGKKTEDTRMTELLSAACSVGVSCCFAAPIGGVLFAIEVTSTYFAVRDYWRAFFGSVMAALVFRISGMV